VKTGNRKIVLICVSLLVVLILFRLLGIIDVNLYTNKTEASQRARMGYSNKLVNYDVSFVYKGKTIFRYSTFKGNQKRISVDVKIDDYKYQGNYYWPLYKNFNMEYKCIFNNIKSKDNITNKIDGNIDGSVKVEIKGICSIRKAKQIAETTALDWIKKYVIDSLSK
jgi:hypothetical protein